LQVSGSAGFVHIARTLLQRHRRRSLLAIGLLLPQSFFYNAIFFSYALILTKFYRVPSERIGLYMIPFAIGNFLGPLLLGRLFDTVGRRRMIAGTYALSAVLLAATGYAFYAGWLTAATQTLCWCVVFFVAAAAASSAYLTVSELFPVEMRGIAIALFFSVGQAAGSIAPTVFGRIVATESRAALFAGYAVAAGLMLVGALVAALFGVDAERRSLEELTAAPGEPAPALESSAPIAAHAAV
jgi:MFS family permease